MDDFAQLLYLVGGFSIVAVAANQIAKLFQKFKLPLITGLLFVGIISGPFVFNLVPTLSREKLFFISDIALAYIAFAAGSELYLKELRNRFKSIKWITASQLVITFLLSGILIYLLNDYLPFLQDLTSSQKIIVALIAGVLFIALSPASAIAIINEVRARGSFTNTVLGVTVLQDFLVIILFAVCLSVSIAIDKGEAIQLISIFWVLVEMLVSFGLGVLLAKLLGLLLLLRIDPRLKQILVLLAGYSMYLLFYYLKANSEPYIGKEFHIEPLLICIIASFRITNYDKNRNEFLELIKGMGLPIYVAFFTLAGAVLSIDVFTQVWVATLVFFFVRLISIMIGAYLGGVAAGDSPLFNRVGWMPYVTQAGVGLGLALIVARTFPDWGFEFSTIITAMIVVNQVVGPPLFKWALTIVGETHTKAEPTFDGINDAVIFGLENQSIALSRQLIENNWKVKIAVLNKNYNKDEYPDIEIIHIQSISKQELRKLDIMHSEAAVLMLTDEENLLLADLIYENFGVKDMVVRLNNHFNFKKFHDYGARIVNPATAIVSLMDHLIRTPQAATLLLGMQEGQDTMDLEVLNPNLHSIALRELRLPSDTIILSIMRGGQLIISHGYTRLRLGDIITVVGSKESLKSLALRFEN